MAELAHVQPSWAPPDRAQESPVVAVLRRGPTEWAHVGRWDVDALTWEHDLAGIEPDPQPPPPDATHW